MARGSDQAQGAASTAQTQAGTNYANSNSLFGPLSSTLLSEAAHPAGIDPTNLARMDTGALETAGGANGGAAAAGALRAARTRNAGGQDAAIAQSARSSGETATRGILANRVKSAEMQEGQRRSALSGLGGLFSENLSGGNQALGQVANNVNANTGAENASWDWAKDLATPILDDATKFATARFGGAKG